MKNIKKVVSLSEAVSDASDALDQAVSDVAANLAVLEQLILTEKAARAALDNAIAELQAVMNPEEEQAAAPPQKEELPEEDEDTESRTRTVIQPLWVGRQNRPTRDRAGGELEAQYHNALYASLANGLGLGTHERYTSTSGKSHNGVWLTEVEHATVLNIASRMQKGDLQGFGVKEALLLVEGE